MNCPYRKITNYQNNPGETRVGKNIVIVAGEASGDIHAANLIKAMFAEDPDLKFQGICGDKMRAAGAHTIADISELSVMGFVEVIMHLPKIYKTFNKIKSLLIKQKPDLLILVDYPGFNLRLAKIAKKLNIKVLFYISPQVWAWRPGRVKKIAKIVDHLAAIFPFEPAFYGNLLPVTYVGHPLTNQVISHLTREAALLEFNLDPQRKTLGLLPGSRESELEKLLPVMLETAQRLKSADPDLQFILLQAHTIDNSYLQKYLEQANIPIRIIKDRSYDVMRACDTLLVASGTATLEAALMQIPMVVVYKLTPITAWLAKRLVKIKYFSLCNIVADKAIVPEFFQDKVQSNYLIPAINQVLYDPTYRKKMIAELTAVKELLGQEDGSKNVAKLAFDMFGK